MPSLICLNHTLKCFRFVHITPSNTLKYAYFKKYFSTSSNITTTSDKTVKKSPPEGIKACLEPPEEPTTCCMSGCANCVWLDYAEALSKYFRDGGEKAIKEINERISDPNIKAYILHEIRMRNKK